MAVNYKYSTGPVENSVNVDTTFTPPGASSFVFVKALNNSTCNNVRVRVKLFELNGAKRLLTDRLLTLSRFQSDFVILEVASLAQYEVQILTGNRKVLVSVWGKNADGQLVAAQRFTQRELTKVKIKR
ncbi:hypothetical protein [Paenibacillus harenae]|uniref:hypothetical protein n=1 Tax=Paenibacillus harenae TaxID=306543 RepID=UPI0027910EC7|nr:hypothetical protein [Paenibacillus harenae]MDQ0062225.1 hypothetical protein [Paenibacillus harenae]